MKQHETRISSFSWQNHYTKYIQQRSLTISLRWRTVVATTFDVSITKCLFWFFRMFKKRQAGVLLHICFIFASKHLMRVRTRVCSKFAWDLLIICFKNLFARAHKILLQICWRFAWNLLQCFSAIWLEICFGKAHPMITWFVLQICFIFALNIIVAFIWLEICFEKQFWFLLNICLSWSKEFRPKT